MHFLLIDGLPKYRQEMPTEPFWTSRRLSIVFRSPYLEGGQDALVALDVVPQPRVGVVDVHHVQVLKHVLGIEQPALQVLLAEAVVRPKVGAVQDDLKGPLVEGLQGQPHVVDQLVDVDLATSRGEKGRCT